MVCHVSPALRFHPSRPPYRALATRQDQAGNGMPVMSLRLGDIYLLRSNAAEAQFTVVACSRACAASRSRILTERSRFRDQPKSLSRLSWP